MENMKKLVAEIIDRKLMLRKQEDGTFECQIEADYRDEMDNKTAAEICSSNEPQFALWEKLVEWYLEAEGEDQRYLKDQIKEELESESGPCPDGLTVEEELELEDILNELVYWTYPGEHFLDQSFCVNIMLDTGDGNYDYTLNSMYPCYDGRYEDRIDEKSSLLWLARQQGYTKTRLWKTLRQGDMKNPKDFLQSCRVEVANLSSHMATLTFMTEMTLKELVSLNRCIRLQDRNGRFFDATKNPYCGYIILGKETMVGLFDPWNGGGSVLGIELEKDVRIPIRFIRSALPDGCDGYGVADVYGMCSSAWSRGEVKKIHAPNMIDEMEAKAV